jgi:hypothetical protein
MNSQARDSAPSSDALRIQAYALESTASSTVFWASACRTAATRSARSGSTNAPVPASAAAPTSLVSTSWLLLIWRRVCFTMPSIRDMTRVASDVRRAFSASGATSLRLATRRKNLTSKDITFVVTADRKDASSGVARSMSISASSVATAAASLMEGSPPPGAAAAAATWRQRAWAVRRGAARRAGGAAVAAR